MIFDLSPFAHILVPRVLLSLAREVDMHWVALSLYSIYLPFITSQSTPHVIALKSSGEIFDKNRISLLSLLRIQ